MSTDKPSRNEEEYFAKREAELIKARQAEAAREREADERRQHYMRCPKCGAGLVTEEYHGIEVDRCTECKGVWFDAGEAESLLDKEEGATGIIRSIFRGVSSK